MNAKYGVKKKEINLVIRIKAEVDCKEVKS